jgi:outer membrane receptor for ferrienterochelin and colicins
VPVYITSTLLRNNLKRVRKYLLAIMAMLIQGIAFSQGDTSLFDPQVITGNYKPTAASLTIHNVKVIDAKTIERMGAVNLKDVLAMSLNVRVGNDNILGSSMSLQGITGQNVKILLDGVPLTGRENGNIDLGQINLNNIERIEIIEGPLSVIYGTDALGGVINLISKKITLDNETPAIGFGNAYYETIKQYNFGGGGIVKLKDIDFGASLNRNFFGGYSPDPESRVLLWKPKQQVFGSFSIINQIDDTGKLRIRWKTDIFNEKIESRGTPVINHVEAYAYDEYFNTTRAIISLNLDNRVNSHSYWNILSSFSYYTRDKLTFRKDMTTTEMVIVPNPAVNSNNSFLSVMSRGNYANTLAKEHKLKNYFNYQFGYDINFNSAFGTKIEADKGRMNDYAIFGCAEFNIPGRKILGSTRPPPNILSIKPGFRATYNTKYSAPFIPSIQLMFTGLKNVTFRYAYGRGFRAPGLKELYLYFVDYNHNIKGNPDLKSELSDNHNIAIKYSKRVSKYAWFNIENSYYFNHIYNQIALVSVNPNALEYTYSNIDNFMSKGANLNFAGTYKSCKLSAGASYTGIYNNAFEQIGKKKYFYSPEVRTQFSYSMKNKELPPTTFSIFHKYNGKVLGYALNDTRNLVNTYTEGYHMLDFTINQPLMQRKVNVTVGCKNILDVSNIRSSNVSNSFHSGGSNTMPISIGRSFFTQININI